MAQHNQDWDDLGRNIQDIIDRAVNSRDYQKLNQTISQTVSRAVDLGSEAVRKVREASVQSVHDAVKSGPKRPLPEQNLPALYGKTGGKTAVGILQIVGGGLISGVSLISGLVSLIVMLMMGGPGPLNVAGAIMAAVFCGGAGLLSCGVVTVSRISRFNRYKKLLGEKTHCSLEKLARGVGKSVKFVRKEIRRMIQDGFFTEGHLNKEETLLITSDETYQYFEQSRLQLEERQRQEAAVREAKALNPMDARLKEVLERGDAFLAEIARCNDEIPGVEISEKITRIETVVRRIFRRAEAHPDVVPDLKKLMDYYLPMTVKLLDAYADMDAQPIQGETIENSKREIEATLDTLNLAFEKLLDDLFEDTAMDISTDISVLNTLLAQEGLTEDPLTKMRKQQST